MTYPFPTYSHSLPLTIYLFDFVVLLAAETSKTEALLLEKTETPRKEELTFDVVLKRREDIEGKQRAIHASVEAVAG